MIENQEATAAEQTQAPRGMENPTPTPRSTAAPSLKFEHTPGPWVVEWPTPIGEFYAAGAGAIIKPAAHPHERVAFVATYVNDFEATASLIAAAPDLLAACQDCMEGRGDWGARMSAAIAKATGAQQS